MAKRHKSPLPDTPKIDRSQNNTGYWERSRVYYKKDYGRALKILDDWLRSPGQERPMFREVREGYIAAMRQLGLLNKYEPEDFQLTKERQKARWRRDYHRDKL